MERGNLERELIQWMGRGAGTDGRKERGWEEERREEGDRPRERKEECEQEFTSFFFTLILLAGMMKARCQCYRNKCQDQMSRDKYKRILEQAICQTVFGVHGRHKEIKEKVGH